MTTAVVKGLASAAASGAATYWCCTQAAMPHPMTVSAVTISSLAGLTYYARVWIQGYYFDKHYTHSVDLKGKVAIVTGGTIGGLGFAAAEILAKMGATVVLTVRSEAKGKEAVEQLARAAGHRSISFVEVDFLSKESVRKGAEAITSKHDRLDMLVLNAGVGGGPAAEVWMANQVGPFLFTNLLTPLLTSTAKTHGDVRVVAVSSGAHKKASIDYDKPYEPTGKGPFAGPYGQSKLAQIMHMRELQRRLRMQPGLEGEQAVRCFSMTPGFALTNITQGKIPKAVMPLMWLLSRSPHVGAHPIKMACIDATVPGGSYLSNCYIKQTEGVDGCSNQSEEWLKLWGLCERCVSDERYEKRAAL